MTQSGRYKNEKLKNFSLTPPKKKKLIGHLERKHDVDLLPRLLSTTNVAYQVSL